jgi:MFS family permease
VSIAGARQAVASIDRALLTLALIGFISQVGIGVMLPLLPLYATQLGASPFVLGLLTSSFAVTNAVGQLGVGFLADRFGSRRFITGGLGLYGAMNLLIATAASAPWLLAWRSLAGFGGGAMIVAERLYLTEVTDRARRAFANGVVSAGQSAGSVTGPAVGGLIAAVADLRAPFIVVAATSVVALVGTLFLPRGRPPPHEAAATALRADGAAAPLAYGALGVLLAANFGLMAGYGGFITTYAPLATGRLGWTTLDVGIAFSFLGAGSIVLGPVLAHLADRFGRRRVAVVSAIPIAAFGAALVAGLPRPVVYGVTFLAGGGLTAFSSAWYALLADASDERRRGRIFGVVSAISNGGIVVGAMIAAQLWERIDIGAGMLGSSVAALLAGVALLAFRAPRGLPEVAPTEPDQLEVRPAQNP